MKEIDLAIIGAGPGGYVAAIRASQLGRKVTLFEKEFIGGTCLNVGCVPSKALLHAAHQLQNISQATQFGIETDNTRLDFSSLMKWKDNEVIKPLIMGVTSLLKKNKVTIVNGSAAFENENTLLVNNEKYRFKDCILATGSKPVELKIAPFSKRVVDSTGALALNELPKHMVVIGAGYIGSELAQAYAMLNVKVTLIEATPHILPGFDSSLTKPVLKRFKDLGMTVLTNTSVTKVNELDDGVEVTYGDRTIKAEIVLVAVGRRAYLQDLNLQKTKVQLNDKGLVKVNQQSQTTQSNIYAIGDIVEGLQLAHKASYEAKVVAEVLANKKAQVDYQAIPAVCFTSPEIASVGLQDVSSAKVAEFPLVANSRSIATGQTDGFIRIIYDPKDNIVLGGQVVAENASELISIVTMAVETSLTLEDLALIIFPHPSVSEAFMDTADLGLGVPIHI